MIKRLAPAKINLVLEVLARRPDGYHEICSVVQAVGLFDELLFEPAPELSLFCPGLEVTPEDNLVMKAARLLLEQTGSSAGAAITIKKGIPVASGLGGGSSDAAATIVALNDMWQLGLTLEEMARLGARIGSDVPFFIRGGHTALVTGRGESVSPLGPIKPAWVVLLRPPVAAPAGKTGKMYESLMRTNFTQGQYAAKMVDGLNTERRINENLLFNVFEEVAPRVFPDLTICWKAMQDAGSAKVNLAGSGPTIYSLFHRRSEAATTFDRISSQLSTAYLARTLD
ncbi:MAG: 4-(cytidine 5'-diphospho)-2-C-methyl-D-erythritol kinase [Chloroflexi bacterium]|nr:4-(cytidine 5'-diphospho)-2-C-methyl-D-erythritol kinase [Chloroflexota bacterium]